MMGATIYRVIMLLMLASFLTLPVSAAASPGGYVPALAYDPVNNRFLAVFQRVVPDLSQEICGQLLNPDGSSFGPEFVISNAAGSRYNPSVAYDSANERFLVTWEDYRSGPDNPDIYGQMVRASDGALFNHAQPADPYNPPGSADANFVIANVGSYGLNSSVAYDSANQRFLVVWEDQRSGDFHIYGQFVRASDGALFNHAQPGDPYNPAGSATANFVISNATGSQYSPSVAYNNTNQRFLVVWRDFRSGSDIYGQLVRASDGALFNHTQPSDPYNPPGGTGANFVISNATGSQSSASVAYDGASQRFLVTWSDNRSGTFDIYGQLVRASDAALFNHTQPADPYNPVGSADVNFVISNAVINKYDPSVAYDSANRRFLAAWDDGNFAIFGQLVNSDGSLYDTASNVNFLIAADADSQNNPVAAFNPACGNFLTIFETNEGGVYDIGLKIVGPPCCAPPPSGMVSWWGGDNNALDMVGGNNGTLVNDATFAPGMVGQAFSFDGVDNYVDLGSSASLDLTDFTLDAWVYVDSSTNAGERRLISRDDWTVEGGDGREYYMLKSSSSDNCGSNGKPWFEVARAGSTGGICSPSSLATGWHHLAGTRSGTTISLYIDGVSVASATVTVSGNISPEAPLVLGTINPSQLTEMFNGLIDEVEIFSRALTASEVAAIYNAGSTGKCRSCAPPPSNMISWWPGDDSADDIVGLNNGTLQGGATFAPGMVGQAFSFDGGGGYVEMPGTVGDFGSAAFTVDFWMYAANGPADGYLVGKSHPDGGFGWDIRWKNDAKIYVVGVNGWGVNITSDASATLNVWHHIALASTDSLVTLYVDGGEKGTSLRSPISSTGNSFRMGYTTNYGAAPFKGLLDEVEIFNRALSAEEVTAIYNAGSAGQCAYTMVTNSPSNGTIACNTPVASGYDVVCIITPNTGYYLSVLLDNTIPVDITGSVINGTYTITNVTEPHTVEATFSEYMIKRVRVLSPDYYSNLLTEVFPEVTGGDTVMLRQGTFAGSAFDRTGVSITLKGGYNTGFEPTGQHSTISDQLTISRGTVTVENVTIQ